MILVPVYISVWLIGFISKGRILILTLSRLSLVVMTSMKLKCRVVHCFSLCATGTRVLIITMCLLQVPGFLL